MEPIAGMPVLADTGIGKRIAGVSRAESGRPVFVRLMQAAAIAGGLFTLVGASVAIITLHTAAIAQSRAMLDHVSGVGSEQVAGIIRAVGYKLQDVSAGILAAAARNGSDVETEMHSAATTTLLAELVRESPLLTAVGVGDVSGALRNSSRGFPAGGLSYADRDVFVVPAGVSEPYRLFLSKVQPGRSGPPIMFVSRRLGSDPARFRGVVAGAMPLETVEHVLSGLLRQPGITLRVRRLDGTELLSLSGRPSDGPAGGPPLVAESVLPQYDLTVSVSMPRSEALRAWHRQAVSIALLMMAAVGCVSSMLLALHRQIVAGRDVQRTLLHRNDELEAAHRRVFVQAEALQENDRLLAERSRALKLTLEHMDQGIMMIDARNRVVVHNNRALEIFEIPAEVLDGQPSLDDVLAYQWRQGEFARTGFEFKELIRSGGIAVGAQVFRRERPNGQIIETRSLPLPGGGIVRTYTDITAETQARALAERLAMYDELTGLRNRLSLRRQLDEMLAERPDGVALLHLSLNGFRLLIDARGHSLGDEMLCAVAARLGATIGQTELLARIGGSDFALVFPIDLRQDGAAECAVTLLRVLAHPYEVGPDRLTVTASIGIATSTSGMTPDALLRSAEIAMYRAKDAGQNQIRRFEPAMMAAQLHRFTLEQDLREAVGAGVLRNVYQPIIALSTNQIAGFESLMRWHDPGRGDIGPGEFIPVAEVTGLIIPLGRAALEAACAEAAGWPDGRRVAVNLSPAQFHQDDLVDMVRGAMLQAGLAGDRLELEVTEGMLLQDTRPVRRVMSALRDLGVSLSLDDFGTGHAGLSYLQRFPFQKLKIDRSFVRNLGRTREADTIIEEMLTLARRLGLHVVAEGVELDAQLDHLRRLGCDYVQGYLTGRPVPPEIARTL